MPVITRVVMNIVVIVLSGKKKNVNTYINETWIKRA